MKCVVAVDVGTTGVRAIAFDRNKKALARRYEKIKVVVPAEGRVEHDPLDLWDKSLSVVKGALEDCGASAGDVVALGIATQRGTVTFWDQDTGRPLHNFISWQDIRTADMAAKVNKSAKMRLIRGVAKVARALTKSKKMTLGSQLEITPAHASIRTRWLLDNLPEALQLLEAGNLLWGTIDTWLVWKMTGGKVHATDPSNASATGLFDVFTHGWSSMVLGLLNIPAEVLPEIRPTSGDFGETEPELFGAAIPIRSVVADQQSSLFAQGCFEPGDVKCTHGTGTFIGMNTGSEAFVSKRGLFPFVAWQIGDDVTYMLEGLSATTGELIEWGREIGLYEDPADTERMANEVPDSRGVYFVPAFVGLQFPWWDPTARGTLLGLSRGVNRSHLVRAFLEGLAFRCKDILDSMREDTGLAVKLIRADGGVSKNNFLLQFMADVLDCRVVRAEDPDMTALGAAFLAGLAASFWERPEQLLEGRGTGDEFVPKMDPAERKARYSKWQQAVSRALGWSDA
ncbi:MAG: glycerol kinase GlpK [Promethearchaeota archaeon]